MKKSLKKNSNAYKTEIKEKLIELWKKGADPEGIRVTASAQFTDKLIIEHSPDYKKKPKKHPGDWAHTLEADKRAGSWNQKKEKL